MKAGEIRSYYGREDVQEALIMNSRDREVAGVFRNGSFGPRPNMLMSPGDIITQVNSGVIEFHCSVERWSNPANIRQDNYNAVSYTHLTLPTNYTV